VNRWTKFANRTPIFDIADNVLEEDNKLISDVWNHLHSCVEKAGKDKEKLLLVLNGVVNMEKQLDGFEGSSKRTRTDDLILGSNIPDEVEILPPKFAKTKGSGKRIKGGKEKAIEQQQKKSNTL
jgi:hypothetical protein